MPGLKTSADTACATIAISNIENAGSSDVAKQLENIYQELCIWAKPTYGDAGMQWLYTAIQAAAISVAILNAAMQAQITSLQYEIADAYADLSEERWNRFKNMFAPLERRAMTEAGNLKPYDPDYPDALARATTNVDAAWFAASDLLTDRAKRYGCCCDATLIDDMACMESIALIDGANYNARMEEYWHYYIADKNWNRRIQLLNLGRGIQAIAATYSQHANDALKSVSELVNAGTQGAMKLFGYLGAVAETQYPAMFSAASPVTGQSTSLLGSSLMSGPVTL